MAGLCTYTHIHYFCLFVGLYIFVLLAFFSLRKASTYSLNQCFSYSHGMSACTEKHQTQRYLWLFKNVDSAD